MDIKKLIKTRAREAGIDICRLGNYQVKKSRLGWLKTRRELGYETEFEEKDLDLRVDPGLILQGAKTIIVVGISYNYRTSYQADFKYKGYLSKSSRGLDYHLVLMSRIEKLIGLLKDDIDFNHKAYVDTGPLIDRELAEAVGLGYFGKNCSIINEKYGSFIALGYIITNLDLEADQPLDLDCGSCRLCIEACPTGALMGDYRINPKKCISYLSQTKDIIGEDLRRKMGNKIFGCDSCQLACPKNQGVEYSRHEEFNPGEAGGYIDLEKFLGLSNREFKEAYGSMAASWRGRNILRRNAIIALANTGSLDILNLLHKDRASKSEMIAYYADWAIKEIEQRNKG